MRIRRPLIEMDELDIRNEIAQHFRIPPETVHVLRMEIIPGKPVASVRFDIPAQKYKRDQPKLRTNKT